MEVYLIRHGQTDGNVAFRHQHPKTALNEVGWEQGRVLAGQVRKLKPTHIISSTHLRAVQTARLMIDCCDEVIPVTHPAFIELQRPLDLVGERIIGVRSIRYVYDWFFGRVKVGGESYRDFITRIKEARAYLESLPPDSVVVVVSHSVFISVFLEHLCSDEPMSFMKASFRFFKMVRLPNAGIVHLQYTDKLKGDCGWRRVK